MKKRAASAVSNWIADGKLRAPALVERDGDELVDVDEADKMLAAELDPSQQLAQDNPIGVVVTTTSSGSSAADQADAPVRVEADDPDNRRFVKARADRMEAEAEGLRRKRLEEAGKWLDREAAEAAFAKKFAEAIATIEAHLAPWSETIAAELNVEGLRVETILAREWRAFRNRQVIAAGGTVDEDEEATPVQAIAAE